MVDIASQAVSFSGTPRSASPQYIQSAINGNAPGTSYTLLSGTHRGQQFTLQSGDTLLLASGAVLNGTEDVGTSGWTNQGGGVWSKPLQTKDRQGNAAGIGCNAGFDCESVEVMIFTGLLVPWYNSLGAVDANGCYTDGSTVWIGRDPFTQSSIEIARAEYINGDAAVMRGSSLAERARMYGYASGEGAASQHGLRLGSGNVGFF